MQTKLEPFPFLFPFLAWLCFASPRHSRTANRLGKRVAGYAYAREELVLAIEANLCPFLAAVPLASALPAMTVPRPSASMTLPVAGSHIWKEGMPRTPNLWPSPSMALPDIVYPYPGLKYLYCCCCSGGGGGGDGGYLIISRESGRVHRHVEVTGRLAIALRCGRHAEWLWGEKPLRNSVRSRSRSIYRSRCGGDVHRGTTGRGNTYAGPDPVGSYGVRRPSGRCEEDSEVYAGLVLDHSFSKAWGGHKGPFGCDHVPALRYGSAWRGGRG
jgi:hypothetical protein